MKVDSKIFQKFNLENIIDESTYLRHAKAFTVLMLTYINDDPIELEVAFKSVITNTIVPDEILIIVDGPVNKNIRETLNSFVINFPSIVKVVYQSFNRGRGNAAAQGVLLAKNQLIARMDSDDICVYDRFEKQLAILKERPNLSIIGGQVSEFNEGLELTTRRVVPITNKEIVDFSKLRSPFNQPTVMFKKDCVIEVGNYSSLKVLEDYDLWMKMLKEKMLGYNIEDDLVYMRASKNMYDRRGGIKYLAYYINFRESLKKRGMITNYCFYKSVIAMIVTTLVPTRIRETLYRMFLRKKAN